MSRRLPWSTVLLILVLGASVPASAAPEKDPLFGTWEDATFARARREKRVLLVMVSTSWCHWCHVMKRTTYKDPAVRRLLTRAFQPILVDADARPDLAERFRNYRWPATAFLTSEGTPILALRGHRNTGPFLEILQDVLRRAQRGGPFPGFQQPHRVGGGLPTATRAGLQELRARLVGELDRHWDTEHGGWGRGQKYPVPEPVLWGLWRGRIASRGALASRRAFHTLQVMEPLIDRAWGGVYQYSVGPGWDRWHPEKIVSVTAGALSGYSNAYLLSRDPRWLRNARDVARWLQETLAAPGGGFFASQDADSPDMPGERLYRLPRAQRERYRRPRVDTRVYARENGQIAQALLRLHLATGEATWLAQARQAVERIWRAHRDAGGLLKHEATDSHPRRFLADQSALGRSLIALHQAEGRPEDLERSATLAAATWKAFALEEGALRDTIGDTGAPGVLAAPLRSLEASADAARWMLDLAVLHEDPAREQAAHALIVSVGSERQVRGHWRHGAGLLLAVDRALAPWVRAEVVAGADDPQGLRLLEAIRPLARRRLDVLWTRRAPREGEPAPAIHLCGMNRCSDPIQDPGALALALESFLAEDALTDAPVVPDDR